MIIRLPFPDMRLSPNQKNGRAYGSTITAKQKQRDDAYSLTRSELVKTGPFKPKGDHIPLSLLFLMPDKRKRDLDNLHAASKALIDGMAKALGVDDSRFKPVLVDWVLGDKPGALIAAVGVTIVSGVAI